MSRIGRARIATLLLAVLGCRDVAAPVVLPPNTRPLAPRPIQYATWWRMTEACSGLQGNLDAITWYLVRSQEIDIGGEAYDGYWYEDGNRILLSKPSVRDGGTVRHEMLHALLQSGAHPVEYFVTRCGALAPCGTACDLSESNRGVPATAREIPSESLSVSVSLSPIGAPAISVDSGWVTMMVTATNTLA